MTLPGSGPISFAQIATELGRTGTSVSLNQSDVAALAGKTTGQAISVPGDFHGKSAGPPPDFNFSAAQYRYNHGGEGPAGDYLTCTHSATWTVTRTGSVNGVPATGSYVGTALSFELPYYGSNAGASWSVSATSGAVTRTCTVDLQVGSLA